MDVGYKLSYVSKLITCICSAAYFLFMSYYLHFSAALGEQCSAFKQHLFKISLERIGRNYRWEGRKEMPWQEIFSIDDWK